MEAKRIKTIHDTIIFALGTSFIVFGMIMPIVGEFSAIVEMLAVVIGVLIDGGVICRHL